MASGTVVKIVSPRTKAVTWRCRWWWVLRGKRYERSKNFTLKADAEKHLTAQLHKLHRGEYAEPSVEPMGAFVERWFTTMRHHWKRPATYHNRRAAWTRYGKDALADVPLKDVSLADIQGIYAGMLDRKLSAATVRTIHDVLRMSLDAAVAQRLIPENPARLATLPARKRGKPTAWTDEQAAAFLAATVDDSDAAFWRLLLTTGMRLGEALALKWGDVDGRRKVLVVARTVSENEDGAEVVIEGAKSPSSNRTITLTPSCLDALDAHRMAQRARGMGWRDGDYAFPKADGIVRRRRTMEERLDGLTAKANLPRLTPHGLRHTWATIALRAGVNPKIVAERLGHASVATTLDLYGHVFEGIQREAADRIDAILNAEGTTTSVAR